MDARERVPQDVLMMEIIESLIDKRMMDTHTAVPVKVVKDSDGHTVRLQPLIKRVQRMPDGTEQELSYPEIPDAPVQYSSGGGTTFTHPVKTGDEGYAVIASRPLDAWHQQGGEQSAVDGRMHDLSDAVYVPGIRSTPRKLKNVSTTAAQIRSDDGEHHTGVDPASGVASKSSKTISHEADKSIVQLSSKILLNST